MLPFEIPDQLQAAKGQDTRGFGDMKIRAGCIHAWQELRKPDLPETIVDGRVDSVCVVF